ncbi:hypothetical protein A7A08_01628 [Methyloligella halotolerans]|uniref:DUF4345 domain-containing protein n=1 Tax=Methyloligella halotolerans TaxID=1177755 RepID=A0A1E2RZF8_9HYPH|nr:DUF4345 domain-containing protein [Methyloligella halotolerans]ODA67594.1 hypothetical protein A7A08_01628 [Methyloligella halotolerans]
MYKSYDLKRAFLIFIAACVCVIALLYGVNPDWFARTFLGQGTAGPAGGTAAGAESLSVSTAHILRAVMGLYLALVAFWLACAITDKHKNAAILTVMVFAGGLLAGRLLSFAIEGMPDPLLIVYAGLEASVLPLAWWVWRLPE